MSNDASDRRFRGIIADYIKAEEAGAPLDQDELIVEHPDLAESLKSFFANDVEP